MYVLCHHAENSKGIGFINIMLTISKEEQLFIILECTDTEGCLKCMFTKIFKQLNVILKEKGNNNYYFHLFLSLLLSLY